MSENNKNKLVEPLLYFEYNEYNEEWEYENNLENTNNKYSFINKIKYYLCCCLIGEE